MSIRTTIGWPIMRMGRLVAGREIPEPTSFKVALNHFTKQKHPDDAEKAFERCLKMADFDECATLRFYVRSLNRGWFEKVLDKMIMLAKSENQLRQIKDQIPKGADGLLKKVDCEMVDLIKREVAQKTHEAETFREYMTIYLRLVNDHLIGLTGLQTARHDVFARLLEKAETLQEISCVEMPGYRNLCTRHPSQYGIGDDEIAQSLIQQRCDRWDKLALEAIAATEDYQSCAKLRMLLRESESTHVGKAWYARMAELHPSVEAEEAAAVV